MGRKYKKTEVAGYEKLYQEGRITEDVYLDKRRELLEVNKPN